MKTQLLFSPLNVDVDIITLFQLYYPDAKINVSHAATLEKIIKKFVKIDHPILMMYNFVFSVESSIMSYLYFSRKLQTPKKISNLNLDKMNLTYYIPESFTDKEKTLLSGILKKVESISIINDKDNDVSSLINVLPLCTNISYTITISIHELYNILISSKKSNYIENYQISQLMFDSISQKYPKLFNDSLLEVFKQNKD